MPPSCPPDDSELEIAFHLPTGMEQVLLAHPALSRRLPCEERRERTTYFDTPGRGLASQGAALRLREREGRGARVQTLKLQNPSDPFRRGEWEWEVEGDHPRLDVLAGTPLGAFAAPALAPVFASEIRRRLCLVEFHGARVELCVDEGRIVSGAAEIPVREVELELKGGEAAAFHRLAARLAADLPLLLQPESKAERGWRLIDGHPRRAARMALPTLEKGIAAGEAFRRLVAASLAYLVAHLPAASAGGEEGIHQMRVALRRLRTVLTLFRPWLEEGPHRRFTAALRELGRVLGEARDWDVFCAATLASAGPGAEALRPAAEAEREAAHARLAGALRRPLLTGVVVGLGAWAEALRDDPSLSVRLDELAPGMRRRMERKVRRLGRHIEGREEEELHALRKAVKRLRYGVEMLAGPRGHGAGKAVRGYLARCERLQEQLGHLNDASVALTLGRALPGHGSPALEALAHWAEAERERGMAALPKAWSAFRKAKLP